MMNALNLNDISSLSIVLSTLEEAVFFSKLCDFIHHFSAEHRVLVYKAFEDGSSQLMAENGKYVESEVLAKGHGLSGYVIRTKRAYYSNGVKRDPLLSQYKYKDAVNAELCVPINCDGSILGTIHIQSLSENKNFNESHVAEILKILSHIEQPIKNMKMFLSAKHLTQELMKKIEAKENVISEVSSSAGQQNSIPQVEMIAQSKVMKDIIEFAQKVAKSDAHLLIEGETGTGKEILSRKIHNGSNRAKSAYIIADCGSKNEAEIDAEVFGTDSKKGLLELANGGTLFIEEVAHLTPALQAKLVRFLIKGEAQKAQSTNVYKVDTRVIVATKKNIKKEAEEGRIREDLYYRLVNLSVRMPALRDRKEDIKVLAEHFLNIGKDKADYKAITSGALEVLMQYSFPGNLRELKSMMERLYIMADSRFIDESLLPESLKEVPVVVQPEVKFSEMTLEELEKSHICRTLDHLKGNKTKTAKALGITVKTLYNKLHAYGMVCKDELSLN